MKVYVICDYTHAPLDVAIDYDNAVKYADIHNHYTSKEYNCYIREFDTIQFLRKLAKMKSKLTKEETK